MKFLRNVNDLVLFFTILLTCYFVIQDWTPISFFVMFVLILNILPHILLLCMNRKTPPEGRKTAILSLLVTIIISGQALFNYVNALYIHPDAQGGLVFLFLPIYLLIQILAVILISWLFQKMRKPLR